MGKVSYRSPYPPLGSHHPSIKLRSRGDIDLSKDAGKRYVNIRHTRMLLLSSTDRKPCEGSPNVSLDLTLSGLEVNFKGIQILKS